MSTETFTDLLERRNELLHRKALLSEIVEHLEKFLDSDANQTELGIVSEGEGRIVPQVIIEAERDDINKQVSRIEDMLTEIDKRKVIEDEQKTKAAGTSKKAKQKQVKKGVNGNGSKAQSPSNR